MTDQIEPHENLYFSIKHSAGDFTRPAQWCGRGGLLPRSLLVWGLMMRRCGCGHRNPQLGVGKHAQIVEVELQRECEWPAATFA